MDAPGIGFPLRFLFPLSLPNQKKPPSLLAALHLSRPFGLVYLSFFVDANNKPGPTGTQDIYPDSNGIIKAQTQEWPNGMSTFNNPNQFKPGSNVYKLPQGSPLPPGISVKADGSTVGGPQPEGHYTIYNSISMSTQVFQNSTTVQLNWTFFGKLP
jgi:hypothetical protein